jgi:hypothetical protein
MKTIVTPAGYVWLDVTEAAKILFMSNAGIELFKVYNDETESCITEMEDLLETLEEYELPICIELETIGSILNGFTEFIMQQNEQQSNDYGDEYIFNSNGSVWYNAKDKAMDFYSAGLELRIIDEDTEIGIVEKVSTIKELAEGMKLGLFLGTLPELTKYMFEC